MYKVFRLIFLAVLSGCCSFASAQSYPTKPVHIVVTSPPGASSDLLARALAAQLSKALGTPFVIDNRPGAGGNVAGDYVAHQPADGYVLLLASVSSHAINPSLYKKMPFDPIKDFEPIIALASNANALVVNPAAKINSVAELLSFAKAHPAEVTYSSGGAGTSSHLAAELFRSSTGIQMLHVPYKGTVEAVSAVVKGETLLTFANIPNVLEFSKAGTLKMLGVTTAKRLPWLPEVPTIQEGGLPGFEVVAWFGLVAPSTTPSAVIQRLNMEAAKALGVASVRQILSSQGFDIMGGTPKDFQIFMVSEIEKWRKVVASSGATAN